MIGYRRVSNDVLIWGWGNLICFWVREECRYEVALRCVGWLWKVGGEVSMRFGQH